MMETDQFPKRHTLNKSSAPLDVVFDLLFTLFLWFNRNRNIPDYLKYIYIYYSVAPAGSTHRYYITGGSVEEERQKSTEKEEGRESDGF